MLCKLTSRVVSRHDEPVKSAVSTEGPRALKLGGPGVKVVVERLPLCSSNPIPVFMTGYVAVASCGRQE